MKKRKLVDEKGKFSNHWEDDYFFITHNSKLMCLICRDTIAAFKEFNVKRHHETKHSDYLKFDREVRKYKLASLKSQLKAQQSMFGSSLQQSSNIVKASYSVALIIAKKMKPFSDGELVKDYVQAIVKDVLPDKSQLHSSLT